MIKLRMIAREPLAHFLLAGAALLTLSTLIDGWRRDRENDRIHVSSGRIQQLRETWSARWGAPPDAAQMQSVIDDFVREEILYRDALASDLDREDTIIRRHLAQKVQFMAQSLAAATEPAESELRQYFEEHRNRYRVSPQVAFAHVYFSPSRRGAAVDQVARSVLGTLESGKVAPAEAAAQGDRFMLQQEYPPQTRDQIRDLFGPQFATRLFDVTPARWEGPISSSYGSHLVRVTEVIPSRMPDFAEIRDQVLNDFTEERLRSASDAYYQKLRRGFRIEIDQQTLAAGGAED
jgi:parvulin-like peptidyl-prolyl isomerase